MKKSFFKNKTIVITGGTGSIGSQILRSLIPLHPRKIKIFSRDEYKQHTLKYMYKSYDNIEYILGDIRDIESVQYTTQGADIVFHTAALKHVPISEEMPEEFIKTNILGSINVKRAALANNIPIIISISSDKAVNPSNVMGFTKAIQEKIFASFYLQKQNSRTKFVNVRFGNVVGTKGSLFPIFYHQIQNKSPITITHPDMTRFFMSKQETIDLIFWSVLNGKNGETVIKKMKSIRIGDLLRYFLELTQQKKTYPVKTLGIRVGEKMHESLITEDEFYKVKHRKNYYVISPYSEKEIEKNMILNSATKITKNMLEFYSYNEKNFFKERDIKNQIKLFVLEVKSLNQII